MPPRRGRPRATARGTSESSQTNNTGSTSQSLETGDSDQVLVQREPEAFDQECEVTRSCVTVKQEVLEEGYWGLADIMSTVEGPMTSSPYKKGKNEKEVSVDRGADPGILRWVHGSMKPELDAAYKLSDEEFKNCCNWWFCLISWKKRDLDKQERIQFAQKEWSVLPTQLNFKDDGSGPKSNEPIAVRVIRQWGSYKKYIFRRLRDNFEALLLMFLEYSKAQPIVHAMFVQVKN